MSNLGIAKQSTLRKVKSLAANAYKTAHSNNRKLKEQRKALAAMNLKLPVKSSTFSNIVRFVLSVNSLLQQLKFKHEVDASFKESEARDYELRANVLESSTDVLDSLNDQRVEEMEAELENSKIAASIDDSEALKVLERGVDSAEKDAELKEKAEVDNAIKEVNTAETPISVEKAYSKLQDATKTNNTEDKSGEIYSTKLMNAISALADYQKELANERDKKDKRNIIRNLRLSLFQRSLDRQITSAQKKAQAYKEYLDKTKEAKKEEGFIARQVEAIKEFKKKQVDRWRKIQGFIAKGSELKKKGTSILANLASKGSSLLTGAVQTGAQISMVKDIGSFIYDNYATRLFEKVDNLFSADEDNDGIPDFLDPDSLDSEKIEEAAEKAVEGLENMFRDSTKHIFDNGIKGLAQVYLTMDFPGVLFGTLGMLYQGFRGVLELLKPTVEKIPIIGDNLSSSITNILDTMPDLTLSKEDDERRIENLKLKKVGAPIDSSKFQIKTAISESKIQGLHMGKIGTKEIKEAYEKVGYPNDAVITSAVRPKSEEKSGHHSYGRAIDLRMPGYSKGKIDKEAAIKLGNILLKEGNGDYGVLIHENYNTKDMTRSSGYHFHLTNYSSQYPTGDLNDGPMNPNIADEKKFQQEYSNVKLRSGKFEKHYRGKDQVIAKFKGYNEVETYTPEEYHTIIEGGSTATSDGSNPTPPSPDNSVSIDLNAKDVGDPGFEGLDTNELLIQVGDLILEGIQSMIPDNTSNPGYLSVQPRRVLNDGFYE